MDSFVAFLAPGAAETVVIVVISAVWFVIPLVVVIWFGRKTLENKRENVRLRLEVGKLADELEQIRREQHPE